MEGHMQSRKSADTERVRDEWKDVVDVHRCHICGFTAGDVGSLSVHLSSAHPTTVQPHPSKYTSNVLHGQKQEEEVEERKSLSVCLPGERDPKTHRGLDATGEGLEDNTRSSESAEPTPPNGVTKAQQQQASLRSAATSSQRTPPPFAPERTPAGPLPGCPATPVTATSGLNRPHVVCLPQVAERLKLAWQRSDPVHELDGQRALVEAFNAFPYPTSQETGALARQCALPVDDVKTWFMMQRVRYGISWAEEDIRETRHKLHALHGGPAESKEVEVEAASPGTDAAAAAARPGEEEEEEMTMVDEDDDQYDYYDEDDDGEDEEMMRAFGASEGMIAERKREYMPAALWSAPPLTRLEPPPNAGSLQRAVAGELHQFPLHQPPLHQPPPPGLPIIGHLSASPPFVLSGQPLRMRSKKSRAQLMVLRRSFVVSNWPSEGELQRLQGVTALSRHEIRKWFADSRYQLRRSGGEHKAVSRGNHAPVAPHEWRVAAPPLDVLPRTALGDGQPPGPVGEVEVVIKQEDHRDALRTFIRTKEGHAKMAAPSLNGHSEASSASSVPALSSYLLPGYPGGAPGAPGPERHQRLRKKTSEQTEVLRQAFLRCQWPTAEDYSRLEQVTGLPRTQIIHWFGDTRYSFKHARLRWIGPEERRDIATRLEMDASRAWQVRWHKQWPGLGTDGPPQPSPGNWMDASNSSTSSVQTLDGMAGGDFDRWYDLWDGAVQGQSGGHTGAGL
ncbi:homeobox and leucine zipper encoding b [Sardina pilchardus]|uniref:homeobox and leucine zipper encoding b n=1 Tax=Sardina pilchardus TaxID=27697 RepID=UPI002E0E0158